MHSNNDRSRSPSRSSEARDPEASPLGVADIYMRARICTLGEWGWPVPAISEHVGVDPATVVQVLREGDGLGGSLARPAAVADV